MNEYINMCVCIFVHINPAQYEVKIHGQYLDFKVKNIELPFYQDEPCNPLNLRHFKLHFRSGDELYNSLIIQS